MFQFPFGTMHQLNLDWFLQQWQQLRQDWIDEEQHIEDSMQDVYDARDAAIQAKDDAVAAKNDAESAQAGVHADALMAEGFAVGEQGGTPVGPGSPYYQVNAKFYSTNAGTYRYLSEAYARGTMGGTPVDPGDAGYEDNAKYYKEQADLDAQSANDDAAFAAADALVAEGWAKGEQNGVPVSSGNPYYQDNAKYYAAEAQQDKDDADAFKDAANQAALRAEGYALGTQNGTPVSSGSPYYENNAAYYFGNTANIDGENAQKMISASEEASSSAASAHAAGSYFRMAGKLYQATADIEIGDTITAGTNCEEKTIGEELASQSEKIDNSVIPLAVDGVITPNKTWVQGNFTATSSVSVSARRICSDYGYFPKGTKFVIACNGLYYQLFVFKYPIGTPNNEYTTFISWVGGNTTRIEILSESGYIGFDCANGYNYNASTDILPSDYAMVITANTPIFDAIKKIESDLSSASIDYKIISDNKLLNHNSYSYVNGSGLTYVYRTEMIPCSVGTVFKYYGRSDYNYDAVYWRDADKRPIGRAQTDHAIGEYTFTAPANTAYAEFSSYSAENFNVWIDGQKQVGNTKRLIDTTLSVDNPLSGKTLLFIGDSITEAPDYNGGWVSLVQSRNNCTCVNKGKSGYSIGKTPGVNTNLLGTLSGITGTYDYVLLSGGYNDFTIASRANVGSLTDYTYSTLTAETFCGDLESYIRTARTKWIGAKIGFILTMKKEFNDPTINTRQVQYWDLIRNACKKYSIPLLDLYNESGLVGVDVTGITDLVTTTYYKDADGTHPNTDGYEYLYKRVAEFIKGL